ncbi:uncharacterized protein LOC117176952 [Belonocnema kinseyi]|uniref:uncharacterized protein LOC117176952 n=1 Tax=Belonocnema kinseyi TaxID=2817044 RepID=UPI00143E0DF1|nr:uncharacterized protein LOC117176952 [Belonocnema kinseyi]
MSTGFQFPLPMVTNQQPANIISAPDLLSFIRAFQSQAPPIPDYSGKDHEEPRKFLANCERYFIQAHTDPTQWTRMVDKSLKGEAQTWWTTFKGLSFSWAEFQEQLLARFDSVTKRMQLHTALYSRRQAERESVAVFLQEQYLLAQRICPAVSNKQLTTLLLDLVRPTIRRLVRARNPTTFTMLLEFATQAERDEADCTPKREPAKKEEQNRPSPGPAFRRDNERPPPDCRFCPRDCGRNRLMCLRELPPHLGEREYPGVFFASNEIRVDLTLGRTWFKDHDVLHEHRTDILYLGTTERQRIYLVPLPSLPEIQPATLDFNFAPTMPPERAECLRKTLHLYASVFHQGGQLRQTLAVQHDIQLSNPRPFREAPRRYSELKKRFIDEQLHEMLPDGIIEPTTSPWSSAIMIAPKQQDSYRFGIDFRRLNEQTVDVPQCMPRIHKILKDLGKSKIFTTLDLKSGYWQIPLTLEARKYTAFSTPDGGHYQFRVMPFGLKNAPGTFQNLMRHVLAGYWGEFCIAYLDYIIVHSDTWEEHPRHVALVLERPHTYGLTCSPQKYGNHPQPRHVEAILNAAPPRNKKQLASFLDTCNWLMEYIPRYSRLTAPLTDLLSQKRPYR